MTADPLVSAKIEAHRTHLEGQGYAVHVRPDDEDLPDFLRGLAPELLATRGEEGVVMAIQRAGRPVDGERVRLLTERARERPGWRFFVQAVFAPGELDGQPFPLEEIEGRCEIGEQLFRMGFIDSALITFWASAEGAMRHLGRRSGPPVDRLAPAEMVDELERRGRLSAGQGKELRRLLPVADRVGHGYGTCSRGEAMSLGEVAAELIKAAAESPAVALPASAA